MVDESREIQKNAEMIPTKELLKAQRKKAYEEVKAKRKEEKLAAKLQKKKEKVEAQKLKDEALWNLLKPASKIDD